MQAGDHELSRAQARRAEAGWKGRVQKARTMMNEKTPIQKIDMQNVSMYQSAHLAVPQSGTVYLLLHGRVDAGLVIASGHSLAPGHMRPHAHACSAHVSSGDPLT